MSTLYIIATPIGNLNDISFRAIEVLNQVNLVAVEDTRHSAHLLEHYHILTPLISYHDHSEKKVAKQLIAKLQKGESIALITDAGTPLISDPGFELVRLAHEEGIAVTAVPGASALLAALSISGMPTHNFVFEGFLPAKQNARIKKLETLRKESRTLIFYEAPHRIRSMLEDLISIFGEERELFLARELTKKYEQVCKGPVGEISERVGVKGNPEDRIPEKGEFVVVLEGNTDPQSVFEWESLLRLLLEELSPAKASSLVSRISGEPRKKIYEQALKFGQKEGRGQSKGSE